MWALRSWLLIVVAVLLIAAGGPPVLQPTSSAETVSADPEPGSTSAPQVAQSGMLQPSPVVHAQPGPPTPAPTEDAPGMPQWRHRQHTPPPQPVVMPDVSGKLGPPLPDPEHNPAPPPGDPRRLSLFRNTTVPAPENLTRAVSEPSTDQSGKNIFATGNTHAEFSRDNGKTWRSLSPTLFGKDNCCDQVTVYDAGRNRQHWVSQYMPHFFGQPDAGGHLVLANSAGGDFVNWCPYIVAPTVFGRPANENFDYNDLVVGTRYLYLTTRAISFQPDGSYRADAVMLLRVSLDDLAHCRPAHDDVIFRTDIGDELRVPQGVTDTAYAAATTVPDGEGRKLRLLVWPERSQVVTTVDRPVPPFRYMSGDQPATQGHCQSQDGVVINWCAFVRSSAVMAARGGGYLWFAWPAQQFGDQRPFPYTRITKIRENDLRVDGSHDLYGRTVAHLYPALAPDHRGHIGLVDTFGGGTGNQHYFPSGMIGLFDDISPTNPTVDYFLRGQGNGCHYETGDFTEGNWGDYNTIRGWHTGNGVWNATTYIRNDNNPVACGFNPASVTIKNIDFGRERDRANYHRFSNS